MKDRNEADDEPVDSDATRAQSSGAAADTIGPYRVLQRIGEGGMGEVWLAEQLYPVRRQVALKVIKAGMDTAQTVARFEAERQALALMDHPAIAKVFDGGATPQGRPYFVMEYVRGEAITTYCNRHKLTVRRRIELFLQVCDGVQHAHQKGIIHRDLKPSNVLVTLQDDRPAPRIIDFGVAKATTQALTERTLYTELGAFVGTPEYMSPEQAEMTGLDVDTRTDVYALGGILYELLSGVPPFDASLLRSKGLDEMRRTIREVDPPRPSARARTVAASSSAAPHLRAEAPRLSSELRGDFDWITMKALEKDRTHRYESASALAMDIRRSLNNEPVVARPPSAAYRLRKFVRRNRMAVAAGAAVVLALVAGTGFALQGMWRAQAAERRAAADARAAEQVASFLTNLFREVDPTRRSADLTLRDLLDRGAEAIKSLADEPRTQARLQVTMGDVYTRIGAWDPALPLLEGAVDTRRRLERDPADLIEALSLLGTLHEQAGRVDAARAALLEAVAIGEERLDSEAAGLALPLRRLASLEMRTGRYAEAETLARRSLAIVERYQGPRSRDTVSALNLIGASLGARGDIVAAEPYLTRGFQGLEQTVGPDAANLVGPMNNLSNVYRRVGKAEEAERIATRGLALAERHYAPDAPQVAMLLSTRALALVALDRPVEAEPLLLRSLSIDRARRGESPEVADDLRALAHVQAVTGRFVEAEASFREAVAILDRTLDPTATPIAETLQELAAFLRARNRAAEAAALENRAARIRAPARN